MVEDPAYVGRQVGTPFSNKEEIEGLEGYVFHSFETCENGSGDMIGIQYTLVSKTDQNDIVPLSPMGNMSGICRSLILEGPLEKIKASYSSNDKAVNAIKYYRGDASITYGTLLNPNIEWNFDESNSLIGIYGYMEGTVIKQLGFLVYSTDASLCPNDVEETSEAEVIDSAESIEDESPVIDAPDDEEATEPTEQPDAVEETKVEESEIDDKDDSSVRDTSEETDESG